MSRNQQSVLKIINGLAGKNNPKRGIDAHIEQIGRPGSGPHIRGEINARIDRIEELIEHLGRKTAEEWQAKIKAWREKIAEKSDVEW